VILIRAASPPPPAAVQLDVIPVEQQPELVSVIRPRLRPKSWAGVEKSALRLSPPQPPMTVEELLDKADPMYVCGFFLAVMGVGFVSMASDGELVPVSWILTAVSLVSLVVFVKLRL
jgi:hypothetical protein